MGSPKGNRRPEPPVHGPAAPDRAFAADRDHPGSSLDDTVVVEDSVEIKSKDLIGGGVKERSMLVEIVKEDVVRAAVAILLLALLSAVIGVALIRAKTWDQTKELLDLILPALTALFGSAVGFYFGTKV